MAAHVAAQQEQIATLKELVEQQKGNELQESGLPPSPPLMSPFGLPTAGYPASPAGTCSGFNSPLSASATSYQLPATNSPVSGLKSQVSSSIPIYELKETRPAGYQSQGDSTSSSEESQDGFFTSLLDRARIQWLMGDWESLSTLDLDQIQHHPDRAKIALLASYGKLSSSNTGEYKKYVEQSLKWGCSRSFFSKVLLSGASINLYCISSYSDKQLKSKKISEEYPNVIFRMHGASAEKGNSITNKSPETFQLNDFLRSEHCCNVHEQWINGLWSELKKLDNASLPSNIDSRILALYATSAYQQEAHNEGFNRCLALADEKGCPKQVIREFLRSGIRNSMALLELIHENYYQACLNFIASLQIGGSYPDYDQVKSRIVQQVSSINPTIEISKILETLTEIYIAKKNERYL